jgi:hypothetical protein
MGSKITIENSSTSGYRTVARAFLDFRCQVSVFGPKGISVGVEASRLVAVKKIIQITVLHTLSWHLTPET